MSACARCGFVSAPPGAIYAVAGPQCQCQPILNALEHWNGDRSQYVQPKQMGCICPPGSEMTCRGVGCPRGGGMPLNPTSQTTA